MSRLTKDVRPDYEEIIRTGVVAAGGIGGPGIFVPGLDMAGVGAVWSTMIVSIARRSGHEVSPAVLTKLVASAVAAVSGYMLGSKILTWVAAPLVLAFPIAGVPAVMAVNVALNGLFTYRLGRSCARKFDRPDLTGRDVLAFAGDLSRQLIGVPSADEIRAVRDLLAR